MKSYVIGILSFVAGAAISGVAAWKIAEKKIEDKYKAIADEEINSVKERFTVPKVELKEDNMEVDNKQSNDCLRAVANQISKRYTNYSNMPEQEKTSGRYPWEDDIARSPRVITPDEYGENEAYDQISLTLYADGILAADDEEDDIVDKEVVGDALEHIGEYDDDVVHVCDPVKKTYYEILTDNRSYEEATGKEPPKED